MKQIIIKLTKTEIGHLLSLLADNANEGSYYGQKEGSYYGQKDQYWKRGCRITDKLTEAINRGAGGGEDDHE